MNRPGTLFVFVLLFSISEYVFSESTKSTQGTVDVVNNTDDETNTNPILNMNKTPPTPSSGTSLPEPIKDIKHSDFPQIILLVFGSISSIYLIFYLRFSLKKKKKKTLLHKITCSFCLTLLLFYVSLVISYILISHKNDRAAATITRYFIFSLLAWFLIISIELWCCFIYFRDYKVNNNQSNCFCRKEYYILGCLAWILPLLVPIYSIVCSQDSPVPRGMKKYFCFSSHPSKYSNDSDIERLIDFVSRQHLCFDEYKVASYFIFIVVISILGHICFNIWSLKREIESISINNSKTSTRHSYMVYVKLSCITGALCILNTILFTTFGSENGRTIHDIGCIIYTSIISSYGIIISMCLGMKNSSLYGILREHMNRNMIRILPDNISMPHVRIK